MKTVNYAKSIPVTDEFDVVVCGGGPAGIGAAIAAAERGAKTALIERFGFLGGMATAGYVNPMSEFAYNGRQVSGGIPWRFAEEMVAMGGAMVEAPRCNISFNPEVYKLVAQRMVEKAGVKTFMNAYIADCVKEAGCTAEAVSGATADCAADADCEQAAAREEKITGVVIVNKSGMQVIGGKYFIDATGDGDLAHFAGVPMLPQLRDLQPGTLCFCLAGVDTSTDRMHIIHQKNHRFNHQAGFVRDALFALREQGVHVPKFGGPWLATTMVPGCITVNLTRAAMDATDSEDLQKAECQMREDVFCLVGLMKEHVGEFKNCYITSIATVAGVRESRRIAGLHVLTGQEYVKAYHFEDAVARACHAVDIHLPGDEGQILTFPEDAGFIPYRSLIAENFPNLLVAGRAISADADAFAAIRVQVPCMETGQAAGVAAALCLKEGGTSVLELDSAKVVEEVRKEGSKV